jgi:hypothetical protein
MICSGDIALFVFSVLAPVAKPRIQNIAVFTDNDDRQHMIVKAYTGELKRATFDFVTLFSKICKGQLTT